MAEMGRQGVLRPRPRYDRIGGAGDAFVDEPAGSRVTRQQRLGDRVEEDTVAVGRGAGERGERRATRVERAGRDQPRDRPRTDVIEVPGPAVDIIGGEGVAGADEYVPGVAGRRPRARSPPARALRNRDPGPQLPSQPPVVPFVELRAARLRPSVPRRTGRRPAIRRRRPRRRVPAGIRACGRDPPGPSPVTPAPPREPGRRREFGSSHRRGCGDQVPRLEVGEQLVRRLLGSLVFGVTDPGGILGNLVGVGDAGEFLDLA